MPLAQVKAQPRDQVLDVSRELPGVIAEALHVEEVKEQHLTASDIAVWFHSLNAYDKQHEDMLVVVTANWYPERVKLVKGSAKKIWEGVRDYLPSKYTLGVWVLVGNEHDWYSGPQR